MYKYYVYAIVCVCNDARKKQKIEEVDLRDKASYPDGDPYYDSNSPDNTSTSKLLDLSDFISIGIHVDGDAIHDRNHSVSLEFRRLCLRSCIVSLWMAALDCCLQSASGIYITFIIYQTLDLILIFET